MVPVRWAFRNSASSVSGAGTNTSRTPDLNSGSVPPSGWLDEATAGGQQYQRTGGITFQRDSAGELDSRQRVISSFVDPGRAITIAKFCFAIQQDSRNLNVSCPSRAVVKRNRVDYRFFCCDREAVERRTKQAGNANHADQPSAPLLQTPRKPEPERWDAARQRRFRRNH